MAMFYFSFKANLINYPEISWKITFTHPLRTEEAIYKVTLSILFVFAVHTYFWNMRTNKYGQDLLLMRIHWFNANS